MDGDCHSLLQQESRQVKCMLALSITTQNIRNQEISSLDLHPVPPTLGTGAYARRPARQPWQMAQLCPQTERQCRPSSRFRTREETPASRSGLPPLGHLPPQTVRTRPVARKMG